MEHRSSPVVLVADDAVTIQHSVRRAFEREGWSVVVASDGEEALQLADEHAPDAAVLDLLMPGRTGAEVLYGWRKAGHEFPVLVLSAVQDEDQVVGLLGYGAVDYIRKPFSLPELTARVANWVGG